LNISRAFSLVLASSLATACGAGDLGGLDVDQEDPVAESGSSELASLEQGIHNCANPDGTNAVMAALAVASAQELGRWRAGLDFQVNGDRIGLASGSDSSGQPRGRNRCSDGCKGIDALLALQNDNAMGVYVQGETSNTKVLVHPGALRSRMKAKLEEQMSRDAEMKDGDLTKVAKTNHTLTNAGSTDLGGCGPHFQFNVQFDTTTTTTTTTTTYQSWGRRGSYGSGSTTTAQPLARQLENSLYFADQANGWVDFRDLGNNVVAIDPTYGLNEGSSTSAGACEVACTKVSTKSDISGGCCSCGGASKAFKRSAFSTSLFLCQ
jgi:hypothetical protein